jgi:hypothetical protein
MNELRQTIQKVLDTIEDISSGPEVPDDLLVKGTTYFSYSVNRTYIGSDYDNNYTYQVNLIGYIKRLQDDTENTLEIVDKAQQEIEEKLKELNVKTSFQDVTILDKIRKVNVNGTTIYNEINNKLV